MTIEFVARDHDNAHPVNARDLFGVCPSAYWSPHQDILRTLAIGIQREYSNTSTNHPSTNKYAQLNTNHKIQFILNIKLLHVSAPECFRKEFNITREYKPNANLGADRPHTWEFDTCHELYFMTPIFILFYWVHLLVDIAIVKNMNGRCNVKKRLQMVFLILYGLGENR
jgi:hypothetical protein